MQSLSLWKRIGPIALAALLCSTLAMARANQLPPPLIANAAPHEKILYSFQNRNAEPQPFAGLITDTHGNLYGTSAGFEGLPCPQPCGSVFELSPSTEKGDRWSFSVLYAFSGGKDGGIPHGNVIFGPDGNLYGTGIRGGAFANGGTGGVVFQLKPPPTPHKRWTERVIHSFGRASDGSNPQGGVTFDAKGNLYGTTMFGGLYGGGTVFKLSPPSRRDAAWGETVLHSFGSGSDGFYPQAALAADHAGNLFGTTKYGGNTSFYCQSGCGIVFEVSHCAQSDASAYSIILEFNGTTDGATPEDPLIFDERGNLYGTTLEGATQLGSGGTAFQLTLPATHGSRWTETVLYRFPRYQYDAGYSSAGLLLDGAGNLYGTSQSGGRYYEGTAFKLIMPAVRGGAWKDTIVHSFDQAHDGATYPFAALVFGQGDALYGTTPYGGSGSCTFGGLKGCGTIFEISP
jgi:uncharacterized repeat protein (TIGR03803 family)